MPELIIEQRRHDLGGFEVGRLLPFAKRRMVGPFVFLDHMGPVQFAPGIPRSVDVRPHPHIGIATLTYLFEGEIMHRDSVGSVQAICPGEVNWMVAGRGITHSERFEKARRDGGPMDGLQAWVALPDHDEECAPAFYHHGVAELPLFEDGGARGRLVAGQAFGRTAAVRTHSPLFYMHWTLQAGAAMQLPADQPERALYVAQGMVELDGTPLHTGQMAVLAPAEAGVVRASSAAVVVALGGEPVGQRFIEWNFVSSSRERIEQAKADWRAGRMKLPDFDDAECIPLPGDPPPPAEPMS